MREREQERRRAAWRAIAPALLALCAFGDVRAAEDVPGPSPAEGISASSAESSRAPSPGPLQGVVGGTRVIGGGPAATGQFPSVVALVREGFLSPADRQFCGGTVIAPRWVLTAAHCLYDAFDNLLEPGSMRVIAGVTDLRAERVDEETVVTSLYVHPAYDHVSQDAYDDIALIELGSALDAPLSMPFTGEADALGRDGVDGVVVGWGAIEFVSPRFASYPDALHQASVPLVSRENCNVPRSYDGYVSEGQLCAGFVEGGVDSCVGDSGGPLFVTVGERIEQVGVVSYGRGCAEPLFYGIYTNVAAYLGWITDYVTLPGVSAVGDEQPRAGQLDDGAVVAELPGPPPPVVRPATVPLGQGEMAGTGGGSGDGGIGAAGWFWLALLGGGCARRRWRRVR